MIVEDKQSICNFLRMALRQTRAGEDVTAIKYDSVTETVYVYFNDEAQPSRRINVACDSGIAMIRDIMKHIDIG